MKILMLTAVIGLTMCSPALADSVNGQVTDHYKTVIEQTPYRVEICREVGVPGDKTKDALTGAIIGGIIGNNVTKNVDNCLLYTSPSPRDATLSRMPSSA